MSFRHFMGTIRTWCKRALHCVNSPPVQPGKQQDTQPSVTREGRKLTDPREGLLRRVRKWPKQYNPVPDQLTGRLRPPVAACGAALPDPRNRTK